MASQPTFAQLVSLACHDLRTPLATASGFAHTLKRLGTLQAPADRYVEMIGEASQQMAQLLDLLGAAARIESGRFEPQAREVDTREIAEGAARKLESEPEVDGNGATVKIDPTWAETAIVALAECVRRHGGVDGVRLTVEGPTIAIDPVSEAVAPIALGEDLRDLGAAVAVRVLSATGGEASVHGDRLTVRLPQ